MESCCTLSEFFPYPHISLTRLYYAQTGMFTLITVRYRNRWTASTWDSKHRCFYPTLKGSKASVRCEIASGTLVQVLCVARERASILNIRIPALNPAYHKVVRFGWSVSNAFWTMLWQKFQIQSTVTDVCRL